MVERPLCVSAVPSRVLACRTYPKTDVLPSMPGPATPGQVTQDHLRRATSGRCLLTLNSLVRLARREQTQVAQTDCTGPGRRWSMAQTTSGSALLPRLARYRKIISATHCSPSPWCYPKRWPVICRQDVLRQSVDTTHVRPPPLVRLRQTTRIWTQAGWVRT